MKEFDVENWYRKSQYQFFKTYEDPFFNITANIEVNNLYKFCKNNNLSFSLACIYVALKSMNDIEEFRLRIKNNKVVVYDEIHIGSTILNEDRTFSFCYYQNNSSLFEFDKASKQVINKHKKGIVFEPKEETLDLVHCSTLPWISFTGFKHARRGDEAKKGIPKIIFGKLFQENQTYKIPFSVEVSHALMDGYHVALLFSKMQQFINELS
jgi:chloramphenicol O-acetyltransferase type A